MPHTEFLVLPVIAAICGSVGQSLAGYDPGGCLDVDVGKIWPRGLMDSSVVLIYYIISNNKMIVMKTRTWYQSKIIQ